MTRARVCLKKSGDRKGKYYDRSGSLQRISLIVDRGCERRARLKDARHNRAQHTAHAKPNVGQAVRVGQEKDGKIIVELNKKKRN